jgi:glycosyltransferase involved in cell wall biosynthesis
MAQLKNQQLKLIVVGGEADLIDHYRALTKTQNISNNVLFVGRQNDIRPYLWASDAFAFPSYYEAFSISMLEAAGAGLPLIVPVINGIEELIRDGENGFIVEHNAESIAAGVDRFLELTPQARSIMSRTVQTDVQRFEAANFIAAWRSFYKELSKPFVTEAGVPL